MITTDLHDHLAHVVLRPRYARAVVLMLGAAKLAATAVGGRG